MRLWTVWCEYFATGEGISYSAIIGYAKSAKQAKKMYESRFGEYLAIGCEAKEGVVKNAITKFLFSDEVIKTLKKGEKKADLFAYAEYHENRS